ncbi:MAG: site-2 protease family protein [Deltaproteobacteria bacterium]|nr:site-2 protease family protein [Deltaproteobacteria bacterium]
MFGKRIRLFSLLGFEVRIDLSWIIIAVLVTWSLAKGLFPYLYPDLAPEVYWGMGAAGAVGLFASIIFHEFCHSLVARKFGMAMKGITLFIFGGVAEMGEEPPSAKAEFYMAAAGPVSSLFLSGVFYFIFQAGLSGDWPEPVNGVLRYLSWINFLLAMFNLLPAFPLDGGRILRAILWGTKQDLQWATRVSAGIGSGFGLVLIFLGIFSVIRGNVIGGFWWFLIGLFLRGAAQASYQQLVIRKSLEGEHVRRFMNPHPVSVPPTLTVAELVEDYVYKYHYKMFPVLDDGRLVGCVTTRDIKEIPKEQWSRETVAEMAKKCAPEATIGPETDAVKALAIMNQTGLSRLLVAENDRLIGILTLKDLLAFLSLKVELEQ